METTELTFVERIKRVREESDMSYENIARELGSIVSWVQIRNYVKGNYKSANKATIISLSPFLEAFEKRLGIVD